MKQINVISDIYRNISVNFNGFIVNFDLNGKGVVGFDEEQTELVNKMLETHSNIYKGDKLPVKAPALEVNKNSVKEKEDLINEELEYLKNKNKELAIENASLKKEKNELENKLCSLMQENKEKEVENEGEEVEKSKEDMFLKQDLNKKTVAQLKELLNTEEFLVFKEEWKNLIKKEDIISYILNKIKE